MSIESRTQAHLTDGDLVKRPALEALARLRAIRAEQSALEEAELEAAHEARAGGASWRDLAVAAGLGAGTSAQRRYAPASIEERREASRTSKTPVAERQVYDLPGVSLAETMQRLGLTEAQARTQIANGTIPSVEVEYRGRRIRRAIFDD